MIMRSGDGTHVGALQMYFSASSIPANTVVGVVINQPFVGLVNIPLMVAAGKTIAVEVGRACLSL